MLFRLLRSSDGMTFQGAFYTKKSKFSINRSYFRQTEIPETLRCWFRWLLTPTVLSCNVSEIKRNTARKSRFLYPLLNKNLLMKRAGIFLRFSF